MDDSVRDTMSAPYVLDARLSLPSPGASVGDDVGEARGDERGEGDGVICQRGGDAESGELDDAVRGARDPRTRCPSSSAAG